jgi:hypothetical protein
VVGTGHDDDLERPDRLQGRHDRRLRGRLRPVRRARTRDVGGHARRGRARGQGQRHRGRRIGPLSRVLRRGRAGAGRRGGHGGHLRLALDRAGLPGGQGSRRRRRRPVHLRQLRRRRAQLRRRRGATASGGRGLPHRARDRRHRLGERGGDLQAPGRGRRSPRVQGRGGTRRSRRVARRRGADRPQGQRHDALLRRRLRGLHAPGGVPAAVHGGARADGAGDGDPRRARGALRGEHVGGRARPRARRGAARGAAPRG